jgi:DNA-binding winged helix-turn-helix (wHTH) protein/tetratricopeptide (TPR) repeat protein
MLDDLVQFDDFVLKRSAGELRRGDALVPLQRVPLELLVLLLERHGQLVTRQEILERVWGKGVFVDGETSINTAVRKLRRALSDDPHAPRFVATVPARGYQFVAEIRLPRSGIAERLKGPRSSVMVGRGSELASLTRGLDDAVARSGRLFLICGEPGVGKTRLTSEVAIEAEAKGMALMVGHCSEHDEAVAYLPFVEILENFVERNGPPDRLRAALGAEGSELARLLPKLKSIVPELPPSIALPAAQARRLLFNSFFDFATRVASSRAAVMILEDLHWADDSTLSLLDHIARRISDLPLMVICTYRDVEMNLTPELARTLEALVRSRLGTEMRLRRLPSREVATMLSSLSGKPPPERVVAEMFAETEGNPFLVEELFRHLEDEDRLYDSAGQFRSELQIGELDAPRSVRLVVARRMARVSALTRNTVAAASVIGRVFSFEVLQLLSGVDADSILGCLEEAENAGLLVSVATGSQARFTFSHELIRQAVLGGLSAMRRQRLNLKVAEAIERMTSPSYKPASAASRDELAAQLAHYYARGGNPRKAVEYYLSAVRQLADLGSNVEAIALFNAALELLRELPDDDWRAKLEIDLRYTAHGPLGDSKGLASTEVEESINQAMALCRRAGINWERTWWALYNAFWVHHLRPDTRRARDIAAELVTRAKENGTAAQMAEAETSLAWVRMYLGDFELADQGLERAWVSLETIQNPTSDMPPDKVDQQLQTIRRLGTRQNNRMVSGWNLWFLGYPDSAIERMNIATAIAYSGVKTMLADIHGFASYIHELRREPEPMKARAEARLQLSIESGYASGRALSEIYLAWSAAMAGDLECGIARIRQQMAELKASGCEYMSDRCLSFIAIALREMGRFDEALTAIDESFSFTARTGQHYYEAELHRLKGELLASRNPSDADKAERCFRTAIDIARKQHARSWELRAATSLARLAKGTEREAEARAALAATYGWFTEGFDTRDLKDARALLNQTGSSPNRHGGSSPPAGR